MSIPIGAILAGLGGGATSLASAMDDDELLKMRKQAALRQLAMDAISRQKDLASMGAVADTGKPTRGDVMSGIQDVGSFSVPTGLGTADATGALQSLAQAKQTEQTAPRFSLPSLAGDKTENFRIDEEQTPEAKALRKLATQQRGQLQIADLNQRAADARALQAQREMADRQDRQIKAQADAAERLANKPQRVQVDDGNGGVKWAWLRPGQEAPAASSGRSLGGGTSQGSQAPLDDMMTRYEEIEQHGKDLGDKKFKFTNTNATREALQFGQTYAQAEGKPAIGAQLGQTAMDLFGLAKGSSEDQQRYARLMASTRAFGDDAAKVFKGRQGFQNISYEVAQATLRPEDYGHPEIIAQKLNRMRHVVKLAALVAPNQAAAADKNKLARFMSDTPSAGGLPNPEY